MLISLPSTPRNAAPGRWPARRARPAAGRSPGWRSTSPSRPTPAAAAPPQPRQVLLLAQHDHHALPRGQPPYRRPQHQRALVVAGLGVGRCPDPARVARLDQRPPQERPVAVDQHLARIAGRLLDPAYQRPAPIRPDQRLLGQFLCFAPVSRQPVPQPAQRWVLAGEEVLELRLLPQRHLPSWCHLQRAATPEGLSPALKAPPRKDCSPVESVRDALHVGTRWSRRPRHTQRASGPEDFPEAAQQPAPAAGPSSYVVERSLFWLVG